MVNPALRVDKGVNPYVVIRVGAFYFSFIFSFIGGLTAWLIPPFLCSGLIRGWPLMVDTFNPS